jgi:hypothetical protein
MRRGRLIGNQQRGFQRQRHCNYHPLAVREAQIEHHHRLEIQPKLHMQWLIQAKLPAQLLEKQRVNLPAGASLGRVAGHSSGQVSPPRQV